MSQSSSDQRRPFLSAPSPQRYFAAGTIEEARQRIVRAIARHEGPAMLVGGAGMGKSLLLAVLAEQFAPRVAVVTLVGAQLCTRRALLQMILCELGLPYRGMDEGELRLSILEHLRGKGAQPQADAKPADAKPQVATGDSLRRAVAAPRRMLLLVDEADALPTRLLEELRVLTNVAAEGAPLVSLVLAGGPMLEERFADPQLDMFSQRIAARCYLAPLSREETIQYVRSQVAAVGVKPETLFTPDALEAIHAATGGVPRLVNQLGDQLSWMAETAGCAPLDASLVQQAWSDLQQLPAPWNTEGHAATSPGSVAVLEFGELDAGVAPIVDGGRVENGETLNDDTDVDDSDDDEMPASISIATARTGRAPLDAELLEATLDESDDLLDSFSEFDQVQIRAADTEPTELDESAAGNPFDEPFDEEELVLDPYAALESELLRTAPQVVNRIDRAFASELHRCVQRASSKVRPGDGGLALLDPQARASTAAATEPIAADEPLQVRLHEAAKGWARHSSRSPEAIGELLLLEDDDAAAPTIVPGRQFRRLFSCLEASGHRSLMG